MRFNASDHEAVVQSPAHHTQPRYPIFFKIRAPLEFEKAVGAAARLRHQTTADYVRQILLREMRRNGVRLSANGRVESTEAHP